MAKAMQKIRPMVVGKVVENRYVHTAEDRLKDWARDVRKVTAKIRRTRENSSGIVQAVRSETDVFRRNTLDLIDAVEELWGEVSEMVDRTFDAVRAPFGGASSGTNGGGRRSTNKGTKD